MPRRQDELDQVFQLVTAYCLRQFGQVPVYLTLTLPDGRKEKRPVPTPPGVLPFPVPPEPAEDEEAEPRPLDELCRRFFWPQPHPGVTFRFSEKQSRVVKSLLEARARRAPDVEQRKLLDAADSDTGRVRDLFRGHPAWGTMIVQGEVSGTYRLNWPLEPEETTEDPDP
jgi:hypothetical protein